MNIFIKHKNIFKKENKVLYRISILSFFIIVSYYISYDWPELIQGIDRWYKLLTDFCIGIIINLIFYIFQLYIPEIRLQEKSFLLIKDDLSSMLYNMVDIILVTDNCIDITQTNYITIKKTVVYFRRLSNESKDSTGWCKRIELSNEEINDYKNSINSSLDKIINNSMYDKNSAYLIELISTLQSNKFLKELLDYFSLHQTNAAYGSIYNDFNEFKLLTINLLKLIEKEIDEFVELTPSERQEFDNILSSVNDPSIRNRVRKYM